MAPDRNRKDTSQVIPDGDLLGVFCMKKVWHSDIFFVFVIAMLSYHNCNALENTVKSVI